MKSLFFIRVEFDDSNKKDSESKPSISNYILLIFMDNYKLNHARKKKKESENETTIWITIHFRSLLSPVKNETY
jgi:hypothetical protein